MPTVLITGANRGIGLELARAFAGDGWSVVATARKPAAGDLAAVSGVEVIGCDVSDDASVAGLVTALGDRPLDIVINNAGVSGRKETQARGEPAHLDEVDLDHWLQVLEVNTVAPFRVARAVRHNLAKGRHKVLATVSSRLGSLEHAAGGTGLGGMYPYRSSKAAVNMVVRCLATDLAELGITTITLHPGWVRTDMGGDQAPVMPADSAAGLKKVIEGATPDVTGQFFNYDGASLPW